MISGKCASSTRPLSGFGRHRTTAGWPHRGISEAILAGKESRLSHLNRSPRPEIPPCAHPIAAPAAADPGEDQRAADDPAPAEDDQPRVGLVQAEGQPAGEL